MSSLYDIPVGSCTAQLVVSESEAYVAFSIERRPRGPNGEPRVACLLHTTDGGRTWTQMSWRRSVWSQLRHPGFPNWPPEAVISISVHPRGLTITHRDEHVIYEPGGESLWESTFRGSAWSIRKVRLMDYEGNDNTMAIPQLALDLPPSIRPPNQAPQTDGPRPVGADRG